MVLGRIFDEDPKKKKRSSQNIEVVSEQKLVAWSTISGGHIRDLMKNERGAWNFEIAGRIKLLGELDPARGP